MLWSDKIYRVSPNSGNVILGRTLPSLLDEACVRAPNSHAFNQWTEKGWQPLSNQAFRTAAEEVALGLLDLGLLRGDRVALLMHSDVNFCIADMGCLLANLVDVPIDLTQTLENIVFILQHTEAKALIISNLDLLEQVVPYLWDTPNLKAAIVADFPPDWQQTSYQTTSRFASLVSQLTGDADGARQRTWDLETQTAVSQEIPTSACLHIPQFLSQARQSQPYSEFPQCIQVFSLWDIRARGQTQKSESQRHQLRSVLAAHDLATIIYIPGATGKPQGVMLTHENLSATQSAMFTGISNLELGEKEVVLSFLPLTHVFARVLLYGHINYGHSIHFTTPNRVMKHLKEVQPTIFATVPLLLEKVYSKILEQGSKRVKLAVVRNAKYILLEHSKLIFNWALNLARRYEQGQPPRGKYALMLKLVDRLVFSQWRSLFGGRLKYLVCGGAALKAEIVNLFAAARVTILQGYGLTETSSAVACNRGQFNRAGTVGVPLAGVEISIANDGEILVRGPGVTQGYYKNPEATQQAIDEEGWFHTGDIGEFTTDGFLKITGLLKSQFKLSTGKYVTPQPLESKLEKSPLVAKAIAVGAERKFCAMLIFPNLDTLHRQAQTMGLDLPTEELLKHPCILALYQALVDEANCHLPYWSTVKRFELINATLTVENGMLTPTGEIRRAKLVEVFAKEIDALYGQEDHQQVGSNPNSKFQIPNSDLVCPPVPTFSCPAFAQSLNPSLTTQ